MLKSSNTSNTVTQVMAVILDQINCIALFILIGGGGAGLSGLNCYYLNLLKREKF